MTKPEDIRRLYDRAKSGAWDEVIAAWEKSSKVAALSARYRRTTSGWTFLHQAAYFGNEAACRMLIRFGASVDATSRERETAADVAVDHHFARLAELLRHAAVGVGSLWRAPEDPKHRPSSCLWMEAAERRAAEAMSVAYGGGVVRIRKGKRYYVDSFERVLIGFHGTYDPPSGMDGEPMIDLKRR